MYKFLFFLLFTFSVSAQNVYKTPSGKKYHKSNCHTVKNVSEEITLDEAINLGLGACKICKPASSIQKFSNSNKAKGEATTVQCKGKTKKGTRCRHMTRIGNGYCFQHVPK